MTLHFQADRLRQQSRLGGGVKVRGWGGGERRGGGGGDLCVCEGGGTRRGGRGPVGGRLQLVPPAPPQTPPCPAPPRPAPLNWPPFQTHPRPAQCAPFQTRPAGHEPKGGSPPGGHECAAAGAQSQQPCVLWLARRGEQAAHAAEAGRGPPPSRPPAPCPAPLPQGAAPPEGEDEGPPPEEEEEGAGAGDDGAPAAGPWLLLVSATGLGKRVPVSAFRLAGRMGMGVAAMRLKEGDRVAAAVVVGGSDADAASHAAAAAAAQGEQAAAAQQDVVITTAAGVLIRVPLEAAPVHRSRTTRGNSLMRLDSGDQVVSLALVESSG